MTSAVVLTLCSQKLYLICYQYSHQLLQYSVFNSQSVEITEFYLLSFRSNSLFVNCLLVFVIHLLYSMANSKQLRSNSSEYLTSPNFLICKFPLMVAQKFILPSTMFNTQQVFNKYMTLLILYAIQFHTQIQNRFRVKSEQTSLTVYSFLSKQRHLPYKF